jgi:hypothetical protein
MVKPRRSSSRCITVEYCMARGFESKDVESQQAEALRPVDRRAPLSSEERVAVERRRTLELTLTRMRNELRMAKAPAYRQTLEAGIAALEAQISSGSK